MADVTGVRTTFEVTMDVARMYEQQQTVDPAALLALAATLLEDGYGLVLWNELLAIRDMSRDQLDKASGSSGGARRTSLVKLGVKAALADLEPKAMEAGR